MTGNPKSSPWRSTPRSKRKRRGIQLTLSDEAVRALEELADGESKSAVVERLILSKRASYCAFCRKGG